MESGVCFAVFKIIGESGFKLGNTSASFQELPNRAKVCFRQNLFLSYFTYDLKVNLADILSIDFNS